MKYEKTRRQFFEEEIHKMTSQLATILDDGYTVEISRSRSGVKIFKVSRQHETIKRGTAGNE